MPESATHTYGNQPFRPGPGDCAPSLEPPQASRPRRARSADCSTRLGRTPTCTETHHGSHRECAWKRGEGRSPEGTLASNGRDPNGGRRCKREPRHTRGPPCSERESCRGQGGRALFDHLDRPQPRCEKPPGRPTPHREIPAPSNSLPRLPLDTEGPSHGSDGALGRSGGVGKSWC